MPESQRVQVLPGKPASSNASTVSNAIMSSGQQGSCWLSGNTDTSACSAVDKFLLRIVGMQPLRSGPRFQYARSHLNLQGPQITTVTNASLGIIFKVDRQECQCCQRQHALGDEGCEETY